MLQQSESDPVSASTFPETFNFFLTFSICRLTVTVLSAFYLPVLAADCEVSLQFEQTVDLAYQPFVWAVVRHQAHKAVWEL